MTTHIGDIPRPMYAWVKNQFLYDMESGFGEMTECMLYGISALPGRAWGVSALLKNGALVQHLPVHAFNLNGLFCNFELNDLQIWSCYGWDFATHEYSALSEMPVRVYMKGSASYMTGRYWFTAAPYNDQYSATPDQHKHFNFVWLQCGCLAAMPGNRVQFYDSSFVDMPEERPRYIVNSHYWFPEDIDSEPFDAVIDPLTA